MSRQAERRLGAGADPGRTAWFWWLVIGLGVIGLTATVVAVSIGAVAIPFGKVIRIFATHLFGAAQGDVSATESQIVWEFRLPRVLLALIVGAALSVSGTVLQAGRPQSAG